MKIHITRPQTPTPLDPQLAAAWGRLDTKVRFYQAEPYEVHGELLARIYQATLDSSDPKHIISELDFIPEPYMDDQVSKWLYTYPLIRVAYGTRPGPTYKFKTEGLLTGAWFLAFNRDLLRAEPPIDWLREGGPFNDAANLALHHLIATDPTLDLDREVLTLEPLDTYPNLAIEYRNVGSHAFFHRHLNDPAHHQLTPGVTVGDHTRAIQRLLKKG